VTGARARTYIYSIAALLCLIGLADSIYLAVLYVTGETASCGGSASCSQVLSSNYSHAGPVPLAGVGAVAYFCAFALSIFAAFSYPRARTFLAWNVWLMFAVTLWLIYLQAFVLHTFCRYCLFSAAIVFLLAGLIVATPGEGSRT
jgi:uncharacterized membrane protein